MGLKVISNNPYFQEKKEREKRIKVLIIGNLSFTFLSGHSSFLYKYFNIMSGSDPEKDVSGEIFQNLRKLWGKITAHIASFDFLNSSFPHFWEVLHFPI